MVDNALAICNRLYRELEAQLASLSTEDMPANVTIDQALLDFDPDDDDERARSRR